MTVVSAIKLLRKEKDEASLPDCFWQDSLNAFILRFAGGEGFFIFAFNSALVSLNHKPVPSSPAELRKKDQLMQKVRITLALASFVVSITSSSRAQFASNWSAYTQGSGANASYNNPNSALGAPTTFIGYQNADPFNAPYSSSHLVGLGTGGSLTLQFNQPILNSPSNPFGLDFIVFGHAGFNITNGNYSGGGITDGSFYTGGTANVSLSVSADGSTFYTLNPLLAPQVDGLAPADASGDPFLPVNPALTAADFAGKDINGIRALYAGSAGGAGFDLSWASVPLSSVSYLRLNVASGVAYIDAVSVVPEPTTVSLGMLSLGVFFFARRKNQ